jgi:hypothetical protein
MISVFNCRVNKWNIATGSNNVKLRFAPWMKVWTSDAGIVTSVCANLKNTRTKGGLKNRKAL